MSPSVSPTTHLPRTLLTLLSETVDTLSSPSATDPINSCPPSTLAILLTHPASLIKLAHAKIYSYPFSKVPLCWRRLYTDASILEAVRIVRREVRREEAGVEAGAEGRGKRKREEGGDHGGEKRALNGSVDGEGNEEEDWIQRAVRLLDMAVIMAGAPNREDMIETLLLALQHYVQELELHRGPMSKKRRKIDDSLSTAVNNLPEIHRPIPECSKLSMTAFEEHLPNKRPFVIQDAIAHWPALRERPWKNPQYLMERTFGGRRLVPVEVGRNYTAEGWGQKIVTFGEFLDEYLIKEPKDGEEERQSRIGYLAQHDLFTQVPSLRADISIPDYCYTEPPPPAPGTPLAIKPPQPKLDEPLLNAWFGPAGTVSPLHTDPYHNILCQVVGKKYIRLYNPLETENLYPRGIDGGGVDMSNTSEVDVDGDAKERDEIFPLFSEAEYVETVLGEGECLYIPVGWWHFVRSLTVSFSVSFWWN